MLERQIRQCIAELEELSPSGFAIAFHIRFSRPEFLFQTYPRDWQKIYSTGGLVMSDPIVSWGFANNGWTRWSELQDPPGGVLDQGRAFELNFGVAAGVEIDGSRSIAGFSRSDREFSVDEVERLMELLEELHRITLTGGALSPEAHAELRSMSLKFTHPDLIPPPD
ncbi:autoinducer binding domain-containing protein [Pelagovum pacificum]|uniref:Transcriptional regulator n=2 Tax=Pelagovum pacificum TaxID=2588711 RepID=A0A5C5GCR5_9RHOB|nr:autoinducer binding domain-containing protein [Pelagovum pacificum]TNY32595.1 transcriptional regulator [Pelagovum pacificum]